MSYLKLENYGFGITDSPIYADRLRDIDGIIAELKDVHGKFSTHAMSDHALVLDGIKIGLSEVIEYLERI